MPRLSKEQMDFLNNYVKNSTNPLEIPIAKDGDNVACWKFALFGLQDTYDGSPVAIHRPGEFFSAICYQTTIDPKSIWAPYTNKVSQYTQEYFNFQNKDSQAFRNWRNNLMQETCNTVCTMLGFINNSQPKDYTFVMQYEDVGIVSNGIEVHGPNETHWWIEVPLDNGHFVCIQTFPETQKPRPDLEFKFDDRDEKDLIIRVPINNLSQFHVDIITRALNTMMVKAQ